MKRGDFLAELRPRLKHDCNIALLDFLETFKTRRKVRIGGEQFLTFRGSNERDTMFLPLGERANPHPRRHCSEEMLEFFSAFDALRERKPPTSAILFGATNFEDLGTNLNLQIFPESKLTLIALLFFP
jgi:hypothetical protein